MIMTTNSDRGNLRIQRWLSLLVLAIMAIGCTPSADAMRTRSHKRESSSSLDGPSNKLPKETEQQGQTTKLALHGTQKHGLESSSFLDGPSSKQLKRTKQQGQHRYATRQTTGREEENKALAKVFKHLFMMSAMSDIMDAVWEIKSGYSIQLVKAYEKKCQDEQDFDTFFQSTLQWIVEKVKNKDPDIYNRSMESAQKDLRCYFYNKYGEVAASHVMDIFKAYNYDTLYRAMWKFAFESLFYFITDTEISWRAKLIQYPWYGKNNIDPVEEDYHRFTDVCQPMTEASPTPHRHYLNDEEIERLLMHLKSISDKIVTDVKSKNLSLDEEQVEAKEYMRKKFEAGVFGRVQIPPADDYMCILFTEQYRDALRRRLQESIPNEV